MRRSIVVVRGIVGFLWLVQLVLGILFWTGHALSLAQLHMGIGLLFVFLLWVLAILCARSGAPRAFVALTLVWGAIIPVLGYTQYQLLPGPYHWVIRLAHLIVGLIAMPLVGRLSLMTRAQGAACKRAEQ